ncbi:MAG: MBL fold metallo-hydrolase [bacterium]|nr:MBL fold metallo-hydrolase [bacterium]
MRVTYIGHSGFAAELAHCTLLFDYFEGALPAFAPEKPLYVFSSHAHRDHFNFDIFKLRETHPNVTYILSRDIRRRWSAAGFRRHGVEQEAYDAILFPGAHETLQCGALSVETLRSTDEGVAFLVLDPRQGTDFARGFDYFMRCTDTVRAYPMHFWKDRSVFARLRALPCSEPYRDRIAGEEEY